MNERVDVAINQRLKQIIEYKTKNVSAFAKLVNSPQQTIARYVSGERSLPMDFIEMVLSMYPDISAEWLMRGVGDMLKKETANESTVDAMKTTIANLENERDFLRKMLTEKNVQQPASVKMDHIGVNLTYYIYI